MKTMTISLAATLGIFLLVLCVSCPVSPTAPNTVGNPATTVATNTNTLWVAK